MYDPKDRGREAFDLPATPVGNGDSALLLHGLTGSPFEVRHVAERLNGAGMRCLGPVMAGHVGGPEGLAGVGWIDWVNGARERLFELEGSRRTFLVGMSMGALVACVLAHEHPERVDGLALLAPALRLKRAAQLVGMLGSARILAGAVIPKFAGSDVRDPEARRANPCMKGIPLSALRELLALQHEVDRRLPGIAVPSLVVIGKRDHTVELSGARRLVRRIGGRPTKLVVLPESYHLVGVDVERDRCAEEVLTFFEKIPVPRAARPATKGGGRHV